MKQTSTLCILRDADPMIDNGWISIVVVYESARRKRLGRHLDEGIERTSG